MGKLSICMILIVFLAALSAAASADMLDITDVIVKVDDDKQSADESGGTIKLLPDSTLSLKITVENKYDSDVDGGEIENIEIEAILEEIDDGDDLEEVSSDFDLRQGRDKTVTIEFPIPLRLYTDETYKLTVTVTGEDQNNTDHTAEIEFDVDVDKEKHELRFLRKEVSPAKVTCTDTTTLIVGLINTGEEDEDVELVIDAPAIGYTERQEFEMMEDIDDDDNEYEFTDRIDLEGLDPGIYEIPIRALYYDGRRTLEDTLTVEVGECGTTPAPAPTPAPVITPAPAPAPTPKPAPAPEPEETTTSVEVVSQPSSSYIRPASTAVATPRTSYTEKSWISENKWLAVILLTDLILIIAGIIIITAVLKRRK